MIDSYDKLTVGKFLELRQMDITGMEEIDIQVNIIAILNDMDEEEVINLPLQDYQKLVKQSAFLTSQPTPQNKIPKILKLNGKQYDVVTDVKDMTAGQYIDYQTYISYKEDKYLPHILSCIIIPKGEKYGQTDIMTTIKTIEEYLPISVAISLSAFFLNRWQSLTKATLTYLILKMKMMMRKEKNMRVKVQMRQALRKMTTLRSLIKDGDGLVLP